MDLDRLDTLARSVAAAGSRRRVLGLLAALPLAGGLLGLLYQDDAEAKDRRRRRKQRHKRRKNPGSRKGKGCKPKSQATVCAGRCGLVKNRRTCGKTVDCGACACSATTLCTSGCCNLVTGFCVMDCPVQYCHSITAESGACPTAATQFCQDVPIQATSSDHALHACETCFGEGNCTLDIACIACGCGSWSQGSAFFHFADATCCPAIAGELTDFFCSYLGRWAP